MKRHFILFLFISVFLGCSEQESIYSYRELHVEPADSKLIQPAPEMGKMTADSELNSMLMDSVSEGHISWVTPERWQESKAGGMRLATFTSSQSEQFECSLISLAGAAGGEEANIARWITQIKSISAEQISPVDLLEKARTVAVKSGQIAKIIDFTDMTAPADASIIGAVINQGSRTVFVKMTGPAQILKDELTAFDLLLKSIVINNE